MYVPVCGGCMCMCLYVVYVCVLVYSVHKCAYVCSSFVCGIYLSDIICVAYKMSAMYCESMCMHMCAYVYEHVICAYSYITRACYMLILCVDFISICV